ncbi:MAG: hypothetical protein QM831_33550 [Kofleriaceae bacterium]
MMIVVMVIVMMIIVMIVVVMIVVMVIMMIVVMIDMGDATVTVPVLVTSTVATLFGDTRGHREHVRHDGELCEHAPRLHSSRASPSRLTVRNQLATK